MAWGGPPGVASILGSPPTPSTASVDGTVAEALPWLGCASFLVPLLAGPAVTDLPCRLLLLETSNQPGLVGLAEGPRLSARRKLESGRHHARDLAPAIAALLAEQGWTARDLAAVVVSQGPGSYTGLRVGIMSAKTLAYVPGCSACSPSTRSPSSPSNPRPGASAVEVIADAQKDSVYVQTVRRKRGGGDRKPRFP